MSRNALKVVAINLLVLLGLVAALEMGLQAIAWLRPSYDVLFLQPDRVLGWKQVPGLRWRWAGPYWYAAEFDVTVATNRLGFRDLERQLEKPSGVKRIAFLGDSFIEAVQVPMEQTAVKRTEDLLNSVRSGAGPVWETLNFGISNFGVGQYLLAWEEYAKSYRPDYVAVFVAGLHMRRAVTKFESGAFPESRFQLWVRPTFRLEQNRLVLEPARDFQQFVDAQNARIQQDFDGQRMRRRTQLIVPYYTRQVSDHALGLLRSVVGARRRVGSDATAAPTDAEAEFAVVGVRVLEELGQRIARQGGRMVVVDVTRYFGDDGSLSARLNELCRENQFGYVPAFEELLKANAQGISTHWRHDAHFNRQGNDLLAQALVAWLRRQPQ